MTPANVRAFRGTARLARGALLAGLLLGAQPAAVAQISSFRTYSVEDGLAQSQVSAVRQDHLGYLWFATQGSGVSRFDGIGFRTFTTGDGLVDNLIHNLAVDPSGTLWLATDSGVSRWTGGSFETLPEPTGAVYGLLWSGGRLLIGAEDGVLTWNGSSVERLPVAAGADVRVLMEDSEGGLWVGTEDGLYHQTGDTIRRIGVEQGLPDGVVYALHEDDDGSLWVGTEGGLSRGHGAGFALQLASEDYGATAIRTILRDGAGALWAGTDGGGVLRLDPAGVVQQFTRDEGLCSDTVWDIYEDREESLWFGTYRGGVCRWTGPLFSHYTQDHGLPDPLVRAIHEDHRGQLWVGTFGGLATRTGEVFEPAAASGLPGGLHVLVVLEDRNGALWLGTTQGLWRLQDGSIRHFQRRDGLPDLVIRSLAEDREGRLWVGTNTGGLTRLEGERFVTLTTEHGLSDNSVWALHYDEAGTLWIGTDRGLDYFDGVRLRSLPRGLMPDRLRVYDIEEDAHGDIWLGTYGNGLVHLTPARNPQLAEDVASDAPVEVEIIDLSSGDRAENNILFLAVDQDEQLWFGFDRGLGRFNLPRYRETGDGAIRTFDQNDGFIFLEAVHGAAHVDHRGQLWVGTTSGLTRVDTRQVPPPGPEPLTHITEVHLFHEHPNWESLGVEGRRDEELPHGKLRLSHDQNYLTFFFRGLSMRSPEAVRYSFRLEGFEERWSPPTVVPQVTYSNLPPGRYTFKVVAANAEGLRNSQAASYSFEIRKAIWQTIWFQSLSGLLALGVVVTAVRQRTASLERQRRVLEEEIGERRKAEVLLRASEQRFRALYRDNPAIFITTDEHGQILSVNRVAARELERSEEELVGSLLASVHTESERAEVGERLATCVTRPDEIHRWESCLQRSSGGTFWVRATSRAVDDSEGRKTILLVLEDVTHARELAQELSYQASHDELTGLLNRRAFEHQLGAALQEAVSTEVEHALCYLDLDQFKVINDTCGHMAGDELLRQVASQLRDHSRRVDVLARLGGDEFALLIRGCTMDDAQKVAQKLRQSIEELRFVWEDRSFSVAASIGVAPINSAAPTSARVMSAADSACYAAKEKGRNRVQLALSEDRELARRHGEMEWVAHINSALDQDRFFFLRQRILPVGGQRSPRSFFELLLRMRDEQGNVVLPGTFLPAAERYNLVTRLDRWVVDRGMRLLSQRADYQNGLCSLNISGASLADKGFLDYVVDRMQRHHLDPGSICFEITETVAVGNLSAAKQFICKLKELGCRFALDDFGSGVASFAYLKNLPVDYLKIDGLFIRDLIGNEVNTAIVTAIAKIGRVMGREIIAEWVEDRAVLPLLDRLDVHWAQGFAIARPEGIEEKTDESGVSKKA